MDVLFPRSHYVRDCNPLPSPPTRTPPGVRVMGIPDQQKVLEGTVQLVHSSQVNIIKGYLACLGLIACGLNGIFHHFLLAITYSLTGVVLNFKCRIKRRPQGSEARIMTLMHRVYVALLTLWVDCQNYLVLV